MELMGVIVTVIFVGLILAALFLPRVEERRNQNQ